jgi:hypothetical protein
MVFCGKVDADFRFEIGVAAFRPKSPPPVMPHFNVMPRFKMRHGPFSATIFMRQRAIDKDPPLTHNHTAYGKALYLSAK